MGRNNSPIRKELTESIARYEAARAEGHKLYMDASQLADIADWYATEQRFEEAEEVVNLGLQLHPGNTELQVEQAYLYLDMSNLEEAKKVAFGIAEENDREVKLLRAEVYLNYNLLANAQEILYSMEDKDELETIIHIVTLYIDMGFEQIAKEWLDRGEALYADREEFITLKADYLAAIHDYQESIACFDKLIDMSPFNPNYWMGMAKGYFLMGDTDKCIESCDFALAADDTFGEAYAYKAHSYFYIGNDDLSIENYQKAMDLKAVFPQIGKMFIGISYCNKKMWEKSIEYLNEVIAIFEEQGEGHSYLLLDTFASKIHALCGLKRYEDALEVCRDAQIRFVDDSAFYVIEGKIHLTMGKIENAKESFEEATAMDPSVQTWHTIGMIYSEQKMIEDAKVAYTNAYKINPKYSDLPERLAVVSILTNDLENFFKYNDMCEKPFDEETIKQLIAGYEHKTEIQPILNKILEHMRNENMNLN